VPDSSPLIYLKGWWGRLTSPAFVFLPLITFCGIAADGLDHVMIGDPVLNSTIR
jgi:hypothetical protein